MIARNWKTHWKAGYLIPSRCFLMQLSQVVYVPSVSELEAHLRIVDLSETASNAMYFNSN